MPELTWDQIESAPAGGGSAGASALTWDQIDSPAPAVPQGKPAGKRPMTQEESNAAGIRGLKKFGKDVIDVADMVLSTPAFIGSMAVRGATYVGGAMQGRTHKDISSAAKMGGEFFMEDAQKMYLANPIKQLFGAKKLDEKLGESHVARAMGAVQKYVDKGGQYVEHKTNGAVNADDVGFITDVVSTVAGGAAAKGTVKGAQKLASYLKKNKPLPDADMAAGKSSRAAAEDIINKYNNTPEGRENPVTRQTGQDVIDGYAQADKEIKTFNIAHDLILRGASKAEVERTIRKHKNLDVDGQMDAIMARRREVMQGASGDMIMTEGTKPDVGFPVDDTPQRLGFSGPPRGQDTPTGTAPPPAPLGLPAPPPRRVRYNGQATRAADEAQAAYEQSTRVPTKDGIPLEFDEAGGLRQAQPSPTEIPKPGALKTAVEKISAGRSFDLTAEEKVAWNKAKSLDLESGKIPKSQLGGVDRGAGRDALENIVPALGPLLAQEQHTLKTLERLPQNRTEFPKRLVEEQMKRSDVAEAERNALRNVLDNTPGDTVSAKALMQQVRMETGDYSLGKRVDEEYSDYGLDRIGRVSKRTAEQLNEWESADGAGDAPAVANTDSAATHVWQLPEHMELSYDNHFNDPRYFGHTRVFHQNNTRHVTEVQSDLMQRTKPSSMGREELLEANRNVQALKKQDEILYEALYKRDSRIVDMDTAEVPGRVADVLAKLSAANPDAPMLIADKLASTLTPEVKARYEARFGPNPEDYYTPIIKDRHKESPYEAQALLEDSMGDFRYGIQRQGQDLLKSTESAAISSQIGPMRKNWHRRLIREELADAARSGEKVVRFADADTVAKVEGWPSRQEAVAKEVRQAEADLAYWNKELLDYEDFVKSHGLSGESVANHRRAVANHIEAAQQEVTALKQILEDPKAPKFAPEHQGIYDRHKKDVESFVKSLGGKPVKDAEGHSWYEVPVTPLREGGGRSAMFGKVDQDLLTKVGAVGLGVAAVTFLSKEDSAAGNALGAAALLGLGVLAHSKSPAVRHSAEGAAKQLNEALGLVSTTLKNADERVWLRAVDHERRVLTETHRVLEEINPFVEAVRGLPKLEGQAVDLALKNGDLRSVTAVIKALGDQKALESWDKVQTFLKESGKELKELGVIKGTLPNYFPRVVKDLEGLLDSLGAQQKKGLEKALQDAEKKSLKASGQGLDELERSQVVNAYLAGRGGVGSGKPGFTKARVIEQVTPAMAKFYASSDDALVRYANQAVKAKERARFFGKDMVKDPDTGRFNLGASIGELVEKGIAEGKLDAKKAEDIRSVLQSRFGPGERSPVSVIKGYQNLTNAALLGNVFSSMVQLGDAGMAAYAYGMMPTIQTVVQIAAGRKKAGVKDLGLVDHISQEMASGSVEPLKIAGHEVSTAKFLDKIFKVTGFSAVDQFGKTVVINTALNKATRQVASPKGVGDLYARYGEAFGPDFGKLVEGLKTGELTPEVRLYLFAELSRFQPISKLEVPKAYMDNPNGRVIYMLRTYMLKQMDLVRRDALQDVAKGNVRKGATNLTKLVITLGTAGATTEAIRNWLLGREDEFELSDVPENFLKTMGWSQYVIDQAREGKPIQAIAGTIAPPFKVWDDILTQNKNADRYIPLIGPLLHEMNKEEK